MIQILNLVLHFLAATGWIAVIFLVVNKFTLPTYIQGIISAWCVLMSAKNMFGGIRAWCNDKRKKQENQWTDDL